MRRGLMKIIEKAKQGIALTDQEKAYYMVYSKYINKEVMNGSTKI